MVLGTKNISEQQLVEDSEKHLKTVALRTYTSHQKEGLDKERIAEFLPMVRKIVQRVTTYLKPPLSVEDLVSAGTIGLIKAARDFDPSHQAEFETYAYIRIKGAILDELRSFSLLPPGLNKQIQNALQVSREITEQRGSPPSDAELAEKLGITVDKLYRTLENARAQHFLSIDGFGQEHPALSELLSAPAATTPDKQLEKAELTDKLAEAIQQLDKRRRQIILLYYQQHLTMKQIAEVFKITESRVSQLHASAVFNLSVKLRQWKDGRY
ncbi:MAG TPA: FliA/WhiG family RNA polymerase sigma factor [Sedimentisphaerales bacterium]|nr:FliA/WhiG family RNA polymerase sigma factor [Sedimentisphaerales bacterium]